MKSDLLQKAKGVRDFEPEQAILRNEIVDTLRDQFERFGFNPIETPILERFELFASKYGIGQESDAMKETFKLNDQGERQLVLRTEHTVPLARFVAEHPELRLPFKRYAIGEVFRDGPLKLGRYREFCQCDADVIGIAEPTIDAELLRLASQVFSVFELEVVIKINNRKILNAALSHFKIDESLAESVIISIDKLDKIGQKGVIAELAGKGIAEKTTSALLELLLVEGSNAEKIEALASQLGDNDGLREVATAIELSGVDNVEFLPSLARGLAYYTGNVFEVFLRDQSAFSSALSGGGRYDNMIGGMLDKDQLVPAIGISFGLDTIYDALLLTNKDIISRKTVGQLYIIPMSESELSESINLAGDLRERGVNVDIDLSGRKFKKNLEYANSYGFPLILIVGEEEVKLGKYTLKNMSTGEQAQYTIEEIALLARTS